MVEIITTKDTFGGELKIINLGLVKGRNELKKLGYIQSSNPVFMQKGNEYWHYNKTLGYWLYEKVNENKSTVFSGEF
jgi:hypothetical protein